MYALSPMENRSRSRAASSLTRIPAQRHTYNVENEHLELTNVVQHQVHCYFLCTNNVSTTSNASVTWELTPGQRRIVEMKMKRFLLRSILALSPRLHYSEVAEHR